MLAPFIVKLLLTSTDLAPLQYIFHLVSPLAKSDFDQDVMKKFVENIFASAGGAALHACRGSVVFGLHLFATSIMSTPVLSARVNLLLSISSFPVRPRTGCG